MPEDEAESQIETMGDFLFNINRLERMAQAQAKGVIEEKTNLDYVLEFQITIL